MQERARRIAILAPDSALLLTTFYAALRIGALVTPISTLTTPTELAHIVRTSDAQILVGARRFLTRDYGRNLEAALPGLGQADSAALRLPAAPHLRSVWLDDSAGLPWARSIEDLLARADGLDAPDAALLAAVEDEVVPGDEAFVVYTSGSTATPKAVVHGQWAVARQPPVLATYFDVKPSDRTLSLLPAFWMGGISATLQVLSTGSTLVYPTSPDVDVVLDTIERHDVTNIVIWHMLARLQAAAKARGVSLDDIKITTGPTARRERRVHSAAPPDSDARDVGELRATQRGAGDPAATRGEGRCGRACRERDRTSRGRSGNRHRGGRR